VGTGRKTIGAITVTALGSLPPNRPKYAVTQFTTGWSLNILDSMLTPSIVTYSLRSTNIRDDIQIVGALVYTPAQVASLPPTLGRLGI